MGLISGLVPLRQGEAAGGANSGVRVLSMNPEGPVGRERPMNDPRGSDEPALLYDGPSAGRPYAPTWSYEGSSVLGLYAPALSCDGPTAEGLLGPALPHDGPSSAGPLGPDVL